MSRSAFPRAERDFNEREERLVEIRARTATVPVPVSTIEKPLTVIDYIAVLEQCYSMSQLTQYANDLPEGVVDDDRFARAFKDRLDVIRAKN